MASSRMKLFHQALPMNRKALKQQADAINIIKIPNQVALDFLSTGCNRVE